MAPGRGIPVRLRCVVASCLCCLVFGAEPACSGGEACVDFTGHMRWLGSIDPSLYTFYATDIANGIMACASQNDRIRFYDVTEPAQPRLISELDTDGASRDVAFAGHYALVADNWSGLRVVDMSDPRTPTIVATIMREMSVDYVRIEGDRAYVNVTSRTGTTIHIVDIANPLAPVDLGNLRVENATAGCTAWGSYLYVDIGGTGTVVYDVSNPAAPNGRAIVGPYGRPVMHEGLLYVVGPVAGLEIYDPADPLHPRRIGGLDHDMLRGGVENLRFDGDDLYVGGFGHCAIVDVSRPAAPRLKTAFRARHAWTTALPNGPCLYLSVDRTLQIYDRTSTSVPVATGSLEFGVDNRDVDVAGGLAYVIDDYQYFLRIVNVANPAVPWLVSELRIPMNMNEVVVRDGFAYIAGGNELAIVDVTIPAAPRRVARVQGQSYVRGIVLRGSLAYATESNGILILDISDPAAPQVIGRCRSESIADANSVALVGDLAYVAADRYGRYDGSLSVFDVGDPAAPRFLSVINLPSRVESVVAHGSWLYVMGGEAGIHLVDIAQPRAPRYMGAVKTVSGTHRADVVDDLLYVADGESGVQVFDVTSPGEPRPWGFVPLSGATKSVRIVGDRLYASSDGRLGYQMSGLAILPAACPLPPLPVTIDIEPRDAQNRINCRGHDRGLLAVAILTTPSFDARFVDPASVRFGPAGATEARRGHDRPGRGEGPTRHEVDVDRDGDIDLLFHFRLDETGIRCSDTKATLTGRTLAGRAIAGTDVIRTEHGADKEVGTDSIALAPNPFNPRTVVRFSLDLPAAVRIEVFDVQGHRVATLAEASYEPGDYEVAWAGTDAAGRPMPSGAYFVQSRLGDEVRIIRATLLR